MKAFIISVVSVAIILSPKIFAGSNSELILQFNNQSIEKRITEIEKIITASKGVVSLEYCHQLSCFMITINPNEMPDETKMLNDLKQAGLSFDIKTNATIAQVKKACNNSKPIKAD